MEVCGEVVPHLLGFSVLFWSDLAVAVRRNEHTTLQGLAFFVVVPQHGVFVCRLVPIVLNEWAVASPSNVSMERSDLCYAACGCNWDFDWIGTLGQAQFPMFQFLGSCD